MSGQIRFVIFGQGRTGSKLLITLLKSHPNIACDGEVFHSFFWNRISNRIVRPLCRYYPLPLFRYNAYKRRPNGYGFKLFYDHVRWPAATLAQMHREDWQIIHIQRRNLIDQAISVAVSRQSGQWHRREGERVTPLALAIEAHQLLTILHNQMIEFAKVEQALAGIPHLDIVYEDDLADHSLWQGTSQRLLDYLNLPVLTLKTDLLKTWEQPYSDLITNFAELMSAVRQSEFARLLEYPLP